MRIAFDVMGTLAGTKGDVLLEAFRKLQDLGHTCVVWSNSISYAVETVKKHNLNTDAQWKKSKFDLEDFSMEPYDVAVEDDRSQTWLGANAFVWVDEVTNNSDAIVRLILARGTPSQKENE